MNGRQWFDGYFSSDGRFHPREWNEAEFLTTARAEISANVRRRIKLSGVEATGPDDRERYIDGIVARFKSKAAGV